MTEAEILPLAGVLLLVAAVGAAAWLLVAGRSGRGHDELGGVREPAPTPTVAPLPAAAALPAAVSAPVVPAGRQGNAGTGRFTRAAQPRSRLRPASTVSVTGGRHR